MHATGNIITITEPVLYALGHLADEHGVELYAVGGCVRDMLLGRAVKDLDFTVVGDAVAFAHVVGREFPQAGAPVVYEQFGTAMVPVHEFILEFVGTRKEEYQSDSRNPTVSTGTLEDDLRRRDFTVNAIAVSINKDTFGEIIDLFGGREDIGRKILRTPLAPDATFSDDPLRMMRAFRFAAQLNFTIEQSALMAIKKMPERIAIVSQERITGELLKILGAPVPSVGLRPMFETGVLEHVFPDVARLAGVEQRKIGTQEYHHKDVFYHTLQVVDNIAAWTDAVWLRFAALMHDIAKPQTKRFTEDAGWSFHGHDERGARMMKKIFRTLKLPMVPLDYVTKLVRMHLRPMALVDEGVTDSAVRRLIVDAGDDLEDLFMLCRADITSKNPKLVKQYLANYDRVWEKVLAVREKDTLRAFQSPVRGEEIMEICGIPPSRMVGELKHAIEEAILDGVIPNEHDAAREYLMKMKDEIMMKDEV